MVGFGDVSLLPGLSKWFSLFAQKLRNIFKAEQINKKIQNL